MSRDINDILKEIAKTNKDVHQVEDKLSKDINDIKKILKNIDRKLLTIENKLSEFEVLMDAAEIIEDHIDDEEEKYNTEWNPYSDEDYESEDYENYENDDEDEEN